MPTNYITIVTSLHGQARADALEQCQLLNAQRLREDKLSESQRQRDQQLALDGVSNALRSKLFPRGPVTVRDSPRIFVMSSTADVEFTTPLDAPYAAHNLFSTVVSRAPACIRVNGSDAFCRAIRSAARSRGVEVIGENPDSQVSRKLDAFALPPFDPYFFDHNEDYVVTQNRYLCGEITHFELRYCKGGLVFMGDPRSPWALNDAAPM